MGTLLEDAYFWEQVRALPSCDHEMEPRHRIIAGGGTVVYEQCRQCGKASKDALPSRHLSPAEKMALPRFDETAREAYIARKSQQREVVRRSARLNRSGPWWERYNAYVKTPQWQDKRVRVLQRDNYVCQGCLKRPATEAHHTKAGYDHLEHEPLFELVALCGVCHKALTALDRAQMEEAMVAEDVEVRR